MGDLLGASSSKQYVVFSFSNDVNSEKVRGAIEPFRVRRHCISSAFNPQATNGNVHSLRIVSENPNGAIEAVRALNPAIIGIAGRESVPEPRIF